MTWVLENVDSSLPNSSGKHIDAVNTSEQQQCGDAVPICAATA